MVRRPLARWLVVGASVLGLGATYWALVAAFRILALPRFEIPYVEPGAGLCGFGHHDPYEWLTLALVALGLSWAPLGWARARRALVARCLAGLGMLAGSLGLAWLVLVGGGVRSLLGAMQAWRWGGGGVSHPGFGYLNYERLFEAAQIGLGTLALAVALLSLCARLQHGWRFRAEALVAMRAWLFLLLGAAFSVRSALSNEAGCFPLWPTFRTEPPGAWDGLWTTSSSFYVGCLSLAFVAWPAARRRAWFAVPLALAALHTFQEGYWSPLCACQAVDVPGLAVSTATLSSYPAARDPSFAPSEAVQLSGRGVAWHQEQFDATPPFLEALSRNQVLRRALNSGRQLPVASLTLRLAPGASLAQLRELAAGARAEGFSGITFELALEPGQFDLDWAIQVPSVGLLRVPVLFADECGCQLDLGSEGSADAWLRLAEAQLTQNACCLGKTEQ